MGQSIKKASRFTRASSILITLLGISIIYISGGYSYLLYTKYFTPSKENPEVQSPPQAESPLIEGYTGVPTFQIISASENENVTIQASNFPPNQTLTVRMGMFGTVAVGGTVVATTNTGAGGSFQATYNIPDWLKGNDRLAMRMDSPTDNYFAYNWFWNNGYYNDPIDFEGWLQENIQITIPSEVKIGQSEIANIVKYDHTRTSPQKYFPKGTDLSKLCLEAKLINAAFIISPLNTGCYPINQQYINWKWSISPNNGSIGNQKFLATLILKTQNNDGQVVWNAEDVVKIPAESAANFWGVGAKEIFAFAGAIFAAIIGGIFVIKAAYTQKPGNKL